MTPNPSEETTPAPQYDAATEAFLNSGYDLPIKQARNALFIIAAVQLVSGIIAAAQAPAETQTAIWIETGILTAIFAGLALWTRKKAYAALLTGLIVYLAYQALLGIINPLNLLSGIFFKIFIIVYLIIGINNARDKQ